jgi:hypothetical protein
MALPRSLVARRQRAMLEELAEDLERQRGMTLQRYLEELDAAQPAGTSSVSCRRRPSVP